MTDFGSVTLDCADGVGVLTLNAPERRNALNGDIADAFLARLDEAAADQTIGALVITGAGKSLCSGGDLTALARAGDDPLAPQSFAELGRIYAMFTALTSCSLPSVVAAQGTVVGAGLNLVLAADLCVAADDLIIRGFGAAGLHPGGGHLSMLSQKAPAAAPAVALFGQQLSAQDALRTGIAYCVVPRSEMLATAIDMARGAAGDPELTRAVTASYRSASLTRLPPLAAVQLERASQVWSLRRVALRRRKVDQ